MKVCPKVVGNKVFNHVWGGYDWESVESVEGYTRYPTFNCDQADLKRLAESPAGTWVNGETEPWKHVNGVPVKPWICSNGDCMSKDALPNLPTMLPKIVATMRDALVANGTRLIDTFKQWDQDSDGGISHDEFHRVWPLPGLKNSSWPQGAQWRSVPKKVLEQVWERSLFNFLAVNDPVNEYGKITYKELIGEGLFWT